MRELTQSFVPLADVADIVWRITRKKDEANHFSDMEQLGKNSFDVANKLPEDSRLKLQALSLANDCYKYKMDLLTNAPVLSDAIKFVENCRDKLEAATPDISLKKVREDCITDKNEKNDIQGSSEVNIGNISSTRTTNQTF